ncbi:hypothetical protein MBM_03590 [Drepanopeziza brunnea f. sp. 'multigermtubi' MB_m1]|uniref:Uncharacterized protein n=1 Tax=Marssonina brunnea f. sp. multigermtubi (strain MB_m1) TaxID=1072389 RepID=K1X0U8_MARBU|nr:uncharacterized protein MBM_03590 [Drepanopeziza brunnea f. sp. 'multigermtubi' MB_m1]EKD18597.1 hypothetical protein MBM_03590 [Drepanopeziza brunnea f. sp. 'multigermtubi' MB_m1]
MEFGKTLSARSVDVSKAVNQFCQHIMDAKKADETQRVEDALWHSWKELSRVVAETKPEDQDPIVEFLKRLRNGDGGDSELQVWGCGTTLKELPLLGSAIRDVWNEAPDERSPPEMDDAWVNRNAFAARATAAAKPGDSMDYSLYSIWSLRDTLEDVPPEEELKPAAAKAAAMWMIYASRELWQRAVDRQTYEGKSARAGDSDPLNGKDWNGHSKERWEFWIRAFEKRKDLSNDEETKMVLQKALRRMSQAEHGSDP